MTEQEAKTKWCPFARVAVEWQMSIGSANRGVADDEKPLTLCIGSACMAWRLIGPDEQQGDSFNEHTEPKGDGWVWRDNGIDDFGWFRPARDRSGFCGLAGKP